MKNLTLLVVLFAASILIASDEDSWIQAGYYNLPFQDFSIVKPASDGKQIIVSCPDGNLKIIDAETTQLLKIIEQENKEKYKEFGEFIPYRNSILLCDSKFQIWDLNLGKVIKQFEPFDLAYNPDPWPMRLHISKDNEFIGIIDRNTINLISTDSGKIAKKIPCSGYDKVFTFFNNQYKFMYSTYQRIIIYDYRLDKVVQEIKDIPDYCQFFLSDNDKYLLINAGPDFIIINLDNMNRRVIPGVQQIYKYPDIINSKYVIIQNPFNTIYRYDIENDKLDSLYYSNYNTDVRRIPNSNVFMLQSPESVELLNAEPFQYLKPVVYHTYLIHSIEFLDNNKFFTVVSDYKQNKIRCFDFFSKSLIWEKTVSYKGNEPNIFNQHNIALSPDKKTIALPGADSSDKYNVKRCILFLNAVNGEIIDTVIGFYSDISAVYFYDNDNIVVSDYQKQLFFINKSSGEIVKKMLMTHENSSFSNRADFINFNPENNRAITFLTHNTSYSGSRNMEIVTFDYTSEQVINRLSGFNMPYSNGNEFDVSSDNKYMAFINIMAFDTSVVIYNVNSMTEHKIINNSKAVSLRFTKDGNYLFMGEIGAKVSVWNVESGLKIREIILEPSQFSRYNIFVEEKQYQRTLAISPNNELLATGSDMGVLYVMKSGISGIEENDIQTDAIHAIPNPADKGFCRIETQNLGAIISIDVFDALGQAINRNCIDNRANSIHIETSNLANGTYIAVIRMADRTESVKFIVLN